MARLALPFALALLAFALAGAVHARLPSVVMIYGGEKRTQAYQAMGAKYLEALGGADKVEFHEEYLDNARFARLEDEERMADFLRDRYAGKPVAIVATVDPVGLRFLLKYQARAFPGVPVVFSGISRTTLAQVQLHANFVGVPNSLQPAPTINMALALRPEAREVVIITGMAELDRDWEAALRAAPLPAGVTRRVLTGSSIEDIEREVAALGPESVVVLGTFRIDGKGRSFSGGMAVLARLKTVSRAPIFGVYNNGVGNGVVGTYSVALETISAQGGEVARQLLDGIPIAAISMPAPSAPVPLVDWRELRRWQMSEARLPPGTQVLFRDPSFWEQYQLHVLGVALLLLLETALVAGLLLQRRQRRAAEEQLRENERTIHLAANAAQLVLWNWDIEHDDIWVSDGAQDSGRWLPPGKRTMAGLLSVIHEEDRDSVRRAIERALDGEGTFECEYRVVGSDGVTRWFAGRGRVEQIEHAPRRLRGITLDVTRRKAAELDAQQQRNELAHLSRVTMLGELSGSVAHELNQPLMSILSNAQAARMFLGREPVDLVEIAAILDDIIADDKRAGEVIWGMRRMLKKDEAAHERMLVNDVALDVLRLLRGDLMNRGVSVETTLATEALTISGNRMQLQQVLLNLILNACDAMASLPRAERIIAIGTRSGGKGVEVWVRDSGEGIPPGSLESLFIPFFTTKKNGLGLGLSVCNSIVAAHGGELHVANNRGGGATFTFTLPSDVAVFA